MALSDRDRQFLRTDALCDQRWAEMDGELDHIMRIAFEGDDPTERDRELVRRVLLLVIGELFQRRAKAGGGGE